MTFDSCTHWLQAHFRRYWWIYPVYSSFNFEYPPWLPIFLQDKKINYEHSVKFHLWKSTNLKWWNGRFDVHCKWGRGQRDAGEWKTGDKIITNWQLITSSRWYNIFALWNVPLVLPWTPHGGLYNMQLCTLRSSSYIEYSYLSNIHANSIWLNSKEFAAP